MTEEECREMARSNYAAQMEMIGYQTDGNPKDMVEVVRCKDCIHWSEEYDHNCMIRQGWFSVSPDYFCASGERKEGR